MKLPNSSTAKASILMRYPHAVAEQEYWDGTSNKAEVVIWDIPSSMAGLQEDGVCRLRMLVGIGSDESEAWIDAFITLLQREGKASADGDKE